MVEDAVYMNVFVCPCTLCLLSSCLSSFLMTENLILLCTCNPRNEHVSHSAFYSFIIADGLVLVLFNKDVNINFDSIIIAECAARR